ncbi:type II restriction endonuclease, partial [Helicobacter pylori]
GEKNLQTSRPMWNSNLPKPNAIYVYGVANASITFFKGSDILSYETREVLLKYFDTLDKDEESLKNALKDLENPFGFAPYIRKAYEHKKEFSNHHQIESFFSPNHILREQNVLEFLKTLTH